MFNLNPIPLELDVSLAAKTRRITGGHSGIRLATR